ncbi:MAG: glycosyltransferase [Verrucomicrobiales bacterium]|nr:glycosyltransferase [Verrucomicrobiales bacterium]
MINPSNYDSSAGPGLPREKEPVKVLASGVANPQAKYQSRNPGRPVDIPEIRSQKPRLLWIGDAVVSTGFATVTHSILDHLRQNWDVLVSGINFFGGDHGKPYPVIPANRGKDMWGIDCFPDLCAEYQPDIVVINNDWWNVASFVERRVPCSIVAYMPVDGANMNPDCAGILSRLDAAIWYTDYGFKEAQQAGFRGNRHVIPHGVTRSDGPSASRLEARKKLNLHIPDDAFLVGNINRNQPRKRLDLSMELFSGWIRKRRIRDAWLSLHCRRQDEGWDLEQLARYYQIEDRVIFTEGSGAHGDVSRRRLDLIYQSLDIQITTTSGEGWGLTTMEGMSHRIPQIVPNWAALSEWPQGVVKIPCRHQMARPGINTIGAVPDGDAFVDELDNLYRDQTWRENLGLEGEKWVQRPQFQWENISSRLDGVLHNAVAARHLRGGRSS